MKISRTGGITRLRLGMVEVQIIDQLLTEFAAVIAPGNLASGDPIRERLFPAGYRDDVQQAEFRELTEAALEQERAVRVGQCLAELGRGRALRRVELLLDADAADRWIRVLNDMRLAWGTQLGITDDDQFDDVHPSDPNAELRARYLFLTALQDALVNGLLG